MCETMLFSRKVNGGWFCGGYHIYIYINIYIHIYYLCLYSCVCTDVVFVCIYVYMLTCAHAYTCDGLAVGVET